jgi:chaperonin GroES
MKEFTPSKFRLLVLRSQQQDYTPSGLFIPDSAKEPQIEAKVIASADERYPKDTLVVLANKYVGSPIKINGTELLIVRVDDDFTEVLGTIQETEEKKRGKK